MLFPIRVFRKWGKIAFEEVRVSGYTWNHAHHLHILRHIHPCTHRHTLHKQIYTHIHIRRPISSQYANPIGRLHLKFKVHNLLSKLFRQNFCLIKFQKNCKKHSSSKCTIHRPPQLRATFSRAIDHITFSKSRRFKMINWLKCLWRL